MNYSLKTCVCLIIAVLAFPLCMRAGQGSGIPSRKKQDAAAIFVVTANLRQMIEEDYKNGDGWEQRKELCRDVLLAQPADIYCWQENRTGIADYLMPLLPDYAFSNTVFRDKEAINPIVYSTKRFEKIWEGGFWLSPTPNVEGSQFPGFTRRVANWILLKDKQVEGRQFCVINVHLTHRPPEGRQAQLGVLLNFIKTLSPDIPRIMTGDFNEGLDSDLLKRLTTTGWLDSYTLVHGPADPGATFHGFLGPKQTRSQKKIDFILHNKLLRPIAAEIIRDSRNGHFPSDHYFISAELKYSE